MAADLILANDGIKYANGNIVDLKSAMPATGTYTAGDIVLESTTGQRISGWKRLTTGSNHVLGTDWAYFSAAPQLGTAVATTSGTAVDFTGIPSWVKRITLTLAGVSTNGSNLVQVQLGTSGGIDSSGYLGSADSITTGGSAINSSSAFLLERSGGAGATIVRHGTIILTLQGSNIWTEFGILGASNTGVLSYSAGSKTLSGTLDRIRLTTAGGTDTFDAGSFNILYE